MQSGLAKDIYSTDRFAGLLVGKVFNVYPEANMVDVLMLDGSIYRKVQVIASYASSRSGIYSLPVPKYNQPLTEKQNPYEKAKNNESDVFAVVGFLGGSVLRPVVLGFLFPEENEILCSRHQVGNENGTMFLWKHESNVYIRIAKSGGKSEIEISHPSGVLIKIGGSEEKAEIKNWDKKFRPFKDKDRETDSPEQPPMIIIKHPSGSKIILDSDGNLQEEIVGNISRKVKGNVKDEIEGKLEVIVKGDILRKSDGTIDDVASTINHNS